MRAPKISVVISVYNAEKFLRQCLESVMSQTLKDIEIICVDDGSTDDSLSILEELKNKDDRIRIVSQKNAGAGAARNKGIEIAKGEFFSFLDSDDFFEPDMFEKAYASAKKNDAEIVVFASDHYNMQSGKFLPAPRTIRKQYLPQGEYFTASDISDHYFTTFIWWAWDKLISADLVRRTNLLFQVQRTTNDLYFTAAVTLHANRIAVLDDVLAHYRRENGNALSVTREKSWYCFFEALLCIKHHLLQHGLYKQYEKSFINYIVNIAAWNYTTLQGPTKQKLCNAMLYAWNEEFGVTNFERSFFYSEREYEIYLEMLRIGAESGRRNQWKEIEPVSNPRISILMPSLNGGKYIKECLLSVMNQTIEDIEIICIDAGSNDGTREVIERYASKDHRIKLLTSDVKSYGHQMNMGLDVARGSYIGIVETDDWVEPDMFEELLYAAEKNNADIVKANYYWYWTTPVEKNHPVGNLDRCKRYKEVFKPLDEPEIFTTAPAIWSGIYKRSLITDNNIRFNETLGASFQDTSFHFMICTVAERCYLLKDHLLHYRRDNENSSVNSVAKVFCVSDEMHYYEDFLNKRSEYQGFIPFYMSLKYEKYRWNYERIAAQYQWEFLQLMHEEFSVAMDRNLLCENMFRDSTWKKVKMLSTNPIAYFKKTCKTYATRPVYSSVLPAAVLKQSAVIDPKVSIIIPAYNVEKYIIETLDSVLAQTEQQIEIVCVNDGSTDETLKILLEYAQKDSRISVLNQVNKGQSAGRNAAIAVSRGKYLIFLDGDDLLENDATLHLYKRAEEDQLDVLYYDGRSFYETPELEENHPFFKKAYQYEADLPSVMTGSELYDQMKKDGKYRVSPCLGMYRKQYLLENGIAFKEGIIHEDNLFSFVSLLSAKRVGHTTERFLIRRVRGGSTITGGKTFANVYGYLTSYIGMSNFAQTLPYDKTLYDNMADELRTISKHVLEDYRILGSEGESRQRLNGLELWTLDMLLQTPIAQNEEFNRLNFELSEARKLQLRTSWDYDCMKKSVSFRVGRIITFIPRKLRGGVRCLNDHGLRYTLRRVLVHLHLVEN